MNVEELITELRNYPGDTPVCTNISEGFGFLLNNVVGLLKEDKIKCVILCHDPKEGYLQDTINL